MTAERNFYIRQGDTFTHTIILWEGVSEVDGSKIALDLSGYTIASQIREAGEDFFSDSGALLAEFDHSVEGNVITTVLSSAQTALIPPGKHWYDVQIDDGQEVLTCLHGVVAVVPAVAV